MNDFLNDHQCVTHHHACDCREAHFKQIEARIKELEDILADKTKEEIHALIEKYGDPRYKTSEFALYNLISIAQLFQVELNAEIEKNVKLKEALGDKVVKQCGTCDSFMTHAKMKTYGKIGNETGGRCPFDGGEKKETDTCDRWNIKVLDTKSVTESESKQWIVATKQWLLF